MYRTFAQQTVKNCLLDKCPKHDDDNNDDDNNNINNNSNNNGGKRKEHQIQVKLYEDTQYSLNQVKSMPRLQTI